MFSGDDNSGTFAVLVGLVVLVFAAVGLSLLVDKRLQFSSSTKQIRTETENDEIHLTRLRAQQRDLSSNLTLREPERKAKFRRLEETERTIAANQIELRNLAASRTALEKEVGDLERQFETNRRETRARIWREAAGTRLGTIRTRDGRTFEDAIVSRVTEAELLIRHGHGTARLHATELDESYHERFHWTTVPPRGAEFREQRVETAPARPTAPVRDDGMKTAPRPSAPDAEELRKLRADVIRRNSIVRQLVSDVASASAKRYQGSRSVPGSLETWDARHKRLSLQLERARGELRAARARLAAEAPADPLLRNSPREP